MPLSFLLTDELIQDLKELDNKFADRFAILKNCSTEELDALHKYTRVSMIGASTRIENALLTDIEVNWLDTILTIDGKPTAFYQNRNIIENKLSKDRERSIDEVAGCRAMLLLIYADPMDFFPLKENDLRALHYELMSTYKKAIPYAGKYKIQSNSVIEQNKITKESRVVFKTADPGPITSSAMHELLKWYNNSMPITPWPIATSSELVYRFLAIHPFQDGNGRLGRAMFLMSLLHSKSRVISFVAKYIAIDRYIEKHKEEYYFVLNRCSNGYFNEDTKQYKIQFFLKFMIKVLDESIDSIDIYRNRFKAEQQLSDTSILILECFKENPAIRLTTSIIMSKTNLPRRTVVYTLNSLLNANIIQKYGQGPSSRYQLCF